MKKVVALMSVALIALGVVAFQLWLQGTADRERITILQAGLDSAAAAARTSGKSSIVLSDEAAPPAAPTAADPSVHVASRRKSRLPLERGVLTSPENVQKTRILGRALASSRYPDVGQVLNLKPEEVDGLFDLLAKHEANELESFGANAASREARFQSVAQQKQVNEAELVSLLGSKYSQWTEYKRDLPLRLQVRDLGAVLSANGTPLSDSQARLLLPALVSAKKQIDPRSAPLSPERSRTLVEAASNYLSPDQVDAYRRMLNRQQDSLSQFLPPTMEVTNSPTSLPD